MVGVLARMVLVAGSRRCGHGTLVSVVFVNNIQFIFMWSSIMGYNKIMISCMLSYDYQTHDTISVYHVHILSCFYPASYHITILPIKRTLIGNSLKKLHIPMNHIALCDLYG
jgi:hypothetical protein